MEANAICLECGTAQENPENGLCINGHDDWLEEGDEFQRLFDACKKFKVKNVLTLKYHIDNNIDLTIKNKPKWKD